MKLGNKSRICFCEMARLRVKITEFNIGSKLCEHEPIINSEGMRCMDSVRCKRKNLGNFSVFVFVFTLFFCRKDVASLLPEFISLLFGFCVCVPWQPARHHGTERL
jgi:hypothetical protein